MQITSRDREPKITTWSIFVYLKPRGELIMVTHYILFSPQKHQSLYYTHAH
jgi:hypothetical protein